VRLVVGRIGKPHGVRGEVTIEPRTDDPDIRFVPGARLFTGESGDDTLEVSTVRWHNRRLLVGFAGAAGREGAEGLRGLLLYRDEHDRVLEDEAWYDHDLVGCEVMVAGSAVGSVTDVVHTPGQDLLAVELSAGGTRLVPLVAELVPSVDIHARRVVVADLPGLLADGESGD